VWRTSRGNVALKGSNQPKCATSVITGSNAGLNVIVGNAWHDSTVPSLDCAGQQCFDMSESSIDVDAAHERQNGHEQTEAKRD
jgi:hypothetical protein